MSYPDIIIIVIITTFVFFGTKRGMVNELLGFTGWFISLLIALKFYVLVNPYILSKFQNISKISAYISIVIVLILAKIGIWFFVKLYAGLFKPKTNKLLNQFVGALFGFFQGAFLTSILILSISFFPKSNIKNVEEQSYLAPHLKKFASLIVDSISYFVPQAGKAVQSVLDKTNESQDILKDMPKSGKENLEKAIDTSVDHLNSISDKEKDRIIDNEKKRAQELAKKLRR